MKRTTLLLIITNIILALCIPVSASVGYYMNKAEYPIIINGNELKNADAYVMNGTTYLPIRKVSDMMGCKIEWDSIDKKVIFQNKIVKTEFTNIIDDKNIIKFDAYTIDGVTFIPTSYIPRSRFMEYTIGNNIIKASNTTKSYNLFINGIEQVDDNYPNVLNVNSRTYIQTKYLLNNKKNTLEFKDNKFYIKSE